MTSERHPSENFGNLSGPTATQRGGNEPIGFVLAQSDRRRLSAFGLQFGRRKLTTGSLFEVRKDQLEEGIRHDSQPVWIRAGR